MWNINLKRGAIWKVKDSNNSDKGYYGMGFNPQTVLILSSFYDENDNHKFTYVLVEDRRYFDYKTYQDVKIQNDIKYIQVDRLLTGDVRALDRFICDLPVIELQRVLDAVKINFNIFSKKSYKNNEPVIVIKQKEKELKNEQRETIHKFGIDIYVTENEDVQITKNKRLQLSQKAKDDIIYNSKTDEDIRILCDKYSIYPVKAIKEIRNRLVYQHKQKEG